ncbi:MAG: polysaccharide biosynthesis protein [Rhodospirillales bacterium]|nr:polysaccharide biosynthesis protein [Rhodospirillales bacterium]
MVEARARGRIALNVVVDALLAAAAVPLARWLANPLGDVVGPLWTLALGAAVLLAAGLPFRLSLQYWRFAGASELLGVAAASIAAAALFPVGLHAAGLALPSPAFPAIHALVLAALLSTSRLLYRLTRETPQPAGAAQPVLVVGAGEGANLFIRALAADGTAGLRVLGLLSLGRAQTGRRIGGHPILGGLDEVREVMARLRAEGQAPATLVVTEPTLAGDRLAALMEAADEAGARVARAPRPTALDAAEQAGNGQHGALELRPVALEDLLNRAQVPLDREAIARLVQGRRVLVTGAGGSIGSELARQVAGLGPSLLVLLDVSEFALWQVDIELAEQAAQVAREALVADVRDAARMRAVMERVRPELVFHAAALKHVPIVEANAAEGLLTNALGTRNVADAARAAGADAMVLISTDKAVNPTSVMGASKRLAEMYCQALDIRSRAAQAGTRFITVRFGNVLGSTGSVVPLFQHQLARGGPLTVTHPDMQRYFMTVREAVGLVLQASVAGCAGETGANGGIFVLDMGAPVKILDLARQMIRLAGLRPDTDVPIRFTGLRPGEKLFEEIFHGQEPPVATDIPGLLMATPRTADAALVGRSIEEIAAACRGGQENLARALLARMVPDYTPSPHTQTSELPGAATRNPR